MNEIHAIQTALSVLGAKILPKGIDAETARNEASRTGLEFRPHYVPDPESDGRTMIWTGQYLLI